MGSTEASMNFALLRDVGVGTVKLRALSGLQLFSDCLATSCNLSGEAAEVLTFVCA
jgi:hypothetical protein